ncbi:MAG: DUF2911 domain-containing protein [Bryobacteraceae bacterium]
MRKLSIAIAVAATLGLALLGSAQQRQRVSPHETVSIELAGKKIEIEYGRPYRKGRKIAGGLVPYGQVWRTGADEATRLTTEADIKIGNLLVPAGSYSLFTLPQEDSCTLIVNTVDKQWGAFKYDAAKDLGRVPMQVGENDNMVEQFTISLRPAGERKAMLRMEWEYAWIAVPIELQ